MMYTLKTENGRAIYRDTELGVSFSIPSAACLGMRQTAPIPPLRGEDAVLAAFERPVSGKRLSEIARERAAGSACLLISDATRGVPTAPLAAAAVQELLAGGVPLEGIHFFVATGVHRGATEEEMKTFLGELYGRVSIENHRPFEPDALLHLGMTSRGTPVRVNRRAYGSDLHVQIGKVEPHEFAGFSGGRKSVLPGISSEETIRVNHRPEMILNRMAAIGTLEGNPVSEDMLEAAELFRIDFGINCILNNDRELAAVFTGGLAESHRAAVDFARGCLSVPIEKPDILVTTPGQPLDIDLYQAVKALIALTEVLDERTVALLYCGCAEGVNSPDMLQAFSSSRDLEEVLAITAAHYEIQMDHVLLLSKILRKGARIVLCCPGVRDEEARSMFMEPCRDPAAAMELAWRLSGKKSPRVLFYPRPQTGLPFLP